MSEALDALAPNYRAAVERWPEAPTLATHYAALDETFQGSGHATLESVKSFVECVCLTVLGEFGQPMPSATPSMTDLLVEALRALGISNTRGANKLDKVLSAYNRLSDALSACRNEVGPVAHGKDGFLDNFYQSQLRTFLLTGDALLALLLSAMDGTEPHLLHTREPYDTFASFHARIDQSVFIEAAIDDAEASMPVFVLTIGTSALPDGVELRVEPSRLLYALDREAFVEILAASTAEALREDESDDDAVDDEPAPGPTPEPRPRRADGRGPRLRADYAGPLDHLGVSFGDYLRALGLDPDRELNQAEPALLGPTLLATAQAHMGVDWREREALQSRMRVALSRILALAGVDAARSKEAAAHLVKWLHIQTAAGAATAEEPTDG